MDPANLFECQTWHRVFFVLLRAFVFAFERESGAIDGFLVTRCWRLCTVGRKANQQVGDAMK